MGLDIYVGPLGRYYAGEWETALQQFGREQGIEVEIIRPEGDTDGDRVSAVEAREVVVEWRAAVEEALTGESTGTLSWPEDLNGQYFTEKPGWDGRSAVVLLAAQQEFPQMALPETAPKDLESRPLWDLIEDRYLGRPSRVSRLTRRVLGRPEAERPSGPFTHIYFPELWLPLGLPDPVRVTDVTGRPVSTGSISRLREQLESLNDRTYRGSDGDLEAWRAEPPDDSAFEPTAKFGLAVWLRLARLADDRGLPMILDY